MASNSERIKEKTRTFQIVYVGRTNLCKHCTTNHLKLGIPRPPHSPIAELSLLLEVVMISSAWRVHPDWGQASSRKQSWCGRQGLSNILKLQAMFLYSIYHRAGKTNLFHIRGRFHAGNTSCTFKIWNKTCLLKVSLNRCVINLWVLINSAKQNGPH